MKGITKDHKSITKETFQFPSLFPEEISACAAVHTCYVINTCDHVRPINSFASYDGNTIRACCANKADCQ